MRRNAALGGHRGAGGTGKSSSLTEISKKQTSFKPGFESIETDRERESRSLTQQLAVSSKSEVRQLSD